MAVADWSTTAASNTIIEGTDISEGCAPGNLNDVARKMCAAIKVFYNNTPSASTYMPVTGGTFTGNVLRDTRGAYIHHNSATLIDGRVYVQTSATALPTPAEGMIVLQY